MILREMRSLDLSENLSVHPLLSSKGGLLPFLSEHARIRMHSEDKAMNDKKRAGILRPAQMRHLLRVTEATSRHPERDRLVLLLGLTCAMRVTEIAQLLPTDVMLPSGQPRKEVSLRAAITKGCRQRCIFVTHPLTIEALNRYIEHRWERGMVVDFDRARYRGLMPEVPLILTHKASKFQLTAKVRVLADGREEVYQACDSLQAHVSRLYRAAGLVGCSSHSGRRTFATRLVEQGHDLEVVQRLLGHADLDHTDPYLQPSSATLEDMFSTAI